MQKQSLEKPPETISDGKLHRGLTNGNGFTNGFGSASTPQVSSTRENEAGGKPDLRTYNEGFTNGNGFTMGNDMTNGNGQNGKPNRIPLVKSKARRKRILGFVIAAIMVLAPLSIYLVDFERTVSGIVIDGDFRDWEGMYRHTDSYYDMQNNPNVNIIETSIVVDDDQVSFLLEVDGWVFKGDGKESADQVFIMVDSDADSKTGYLYKDIGADYMIHAYGASGDLDSAVVFMFDNNYKSTEKRGQTDWNAWNPTNNGRLASSGNKIEASLVPFKGTFDPDMTMFAVFQTKSYSGTGDSTESISSRPGYMVIDQEPAGPEPRMDFASDITALKLVASAYEESVTLNSLSFDYKGDISISTSPSLPITLNPGESKEITVSIDTTSANPASTVDISLGSALAQIGNSGDLIPAPVSISGIGYSGYVKTVPAGIVIDGAFGDWDNVLGHADDINEETLSGDSNIDIREYKTVEAEDTMSFYLRVDGTMMKGTELLSGPITVVEKSLPPSDSIRPVTTPNTELPEQYGDDYAYFFFDVDSDRKTGEFTHSIIGSDYMLRIVGMNGEIRSSELFQFNEFAMTDENKWEKICDVDSAIDAKQLETQVLAEMLGLQKFSNIDYYIMMTDWSEGMDTAADPYMGTPGQSGTVSVTKMDENTVHQEPKLSNSRNPYSTRASTRATYNPGNQNGIDIDVVGTDTVNVGKYYNLDRFTLTGTPTISGSGTLMIKATHIYINGSLIHDGAGVVGGNGGTGSGNGNNGGNVAVAGGNGTGGNGDTTTGTGGDGGGGGGYGGAGGSGGAAGGGGTGGGGAAGSAFGDATSMMIFTGFGGGGGGAGTETNVDGGNGGAGGGAVWLQATHNLSITGIITVNGNDGVAGDDVLTKNNDAAGGGGGGSGGGILIKLDSTTNALVINGATLTASGGAGGNGGGTGGITQGNINGGGGGGGGGGGRIKIFYNGSFTNASTYTVTAGGAGTGGGSTGGGGTAGSAGNAGTAGTLYAIPEYTMIAVPVSMTIIVFFALRRNRGRKTTGEVPASRKEVIL